MAACRWVLGCGYWGGWSGEMWCKLVMESVLAVAWWVLGCGWSGGMWCKLVVVSVLVVGRWMMRCGWSGGWEASFFCLWGDGKWLGVRVLMCMGEVCDVMWW